MTAPTPDLDAIRGRATDATPGPWWMGGETMFARDVYAGSGSGDDPLIATDTRTEADSTFIAHAREDIPALLDALAAVTAERDYERTQHEITRQTLDQAWEELHASKQMHEEARTLLDQTLTERDAIQGDNHKIADMHRIVVKQLADAPHSDWCDTDLNRACDCWKAGL